MPEVLKRIRDLNLVTDPTGLSLPLDADSLGAAETKRITADDFFAWIAGQFDIPTVSGSSGYVQFNTSGDLDSDSKFFWDKTNHRLGLNTITPSTLLDARGRVLIDRTAVVSLSNPGEYSLSITNFNSDGGVGYAEVSVGVATDGALIQSLGGVDLWLNRTGNTIKTGGNVVPGATATWDLGLTGARWNNAFIATLTLTNPLSIANGGTGQTSANAALNALLPSQATHVGYLLQTDGTNTSWVSVSGLSLAATNVTYDDTASGYTTTNVQTTLDFLAQLISAGTSNNGSGTRLVSGGGVYWATGYTYSIAAATYFINGTFYTSTLQTITLNAADSTHDRLDVLALDTTGTVVKLTGIPAVAPSAPVVDPQSQLLLTTIYVPAASTDPGLLNTLIYAENTGPSTEWTAGVSSGAGARLITNSTAHPATGLKSCEATGAIDGDYFTFTTGSPVPLEDYGSMVFFIRSKAAWLSNSENIFVRLYSGGSPLGYSVTIRSNDISSFDSSNTSSYQQIVIQMYQFFSGTSVIPIPTGQTFDEIRIGKGSSGSTIGFYLDNVNLQGVPFVVLDNWYLTYYTAVLLFQRINDDLTAITQLSTTGIVRRTGAGTWTAGTTVSIGEGGTGQTTKAAAFDALSPMTTSGDIVYGGAAGTGTRLAGNTAATKKFLTQTGSGSVSAAPAWDVLIAGDIPTITSVKISDFDTQVRTSRLDQMAAPTSDVSMNSHKITNLATPTSSTDAVTKGYADGLVIGAVPQVTAQLATDAALPACTYSNGTAGVGATLTGNSNGALTVDGTVVQAGWKVLVTQQASALQNGIYDVTTVGDGSHPFVLTRNASSDTSSEIPGALFPVEDAGNNQANSLWLCVTTAAPTVGTDPINFTRLNKATDLSPGTGISISGNTVAVSGKLATFYSLSSSAGWLHDNGSGTLSYSTPTKTDVGLSNVENTALSTWAGTTNITTLGTITTGTWHGTAIGAIYGGTGLSSYALGDILYASATNTLAALSGNTSTTPKALVQTGTGSASAAPTWSTFVSGVSNSDSSLTISPTSGAVVASLNTAHINTWTVTQKIVQATGAGICLVLAPATGSPTGDILQVQNNAGSTVYDICDSVGNMFPIPITFNLAQGTAATTGTNLTGVAVMPFSGKFIKAWAKAKTGPTGADFIVDINLGGSTIWSTQSNRLKITAGSTTGNVTTFNTTTFSAGDEITIDIDQVGSTIAGQDITVFLIGICTNNSTNSGNAASGSVT